MPLISTLANGSARGYGFSGASAVANSFESIATVTVGAGGQSTISFTSIPSTYKHLQIRAIARDGGGSNDTSSPKVVFNSDTSSTYARHSLFGAGGGPLASYNGTNTGFTYIGNIAQNGIISNVYAASIIDILDYQNTNKYKTIRALTGASFPGGGNVVLSSALWQSTSAISSISMTSSTATNFSQYTQFALYGIKG